jgi:7-cyano-7-deazaguanine tRNA-ribosyltransferase
MGIMKTAKEALPQDRPLHLFGAGHPMFFAFAVAMGFDFFDSAAYALYAKDDRYMTVSGTEQLPELEYFPCCCPVCSSMTPQELRASDDRQKLLAQHNLHVTFQEIRTIRQAIRERTLWELLEQRARAHPNLLAAMREFARYGKFLGKYDPITKKHFFVLSEFSRKRPDVVAARRRCRNVRGASVTLKPFGRVPQSVFECYPFSQTVPGIEKPKTRNDRQKLRDVSLYWFGEDVFPEKVRIDVSRATGKMRAAYDSKGGLLAVVRPNDFMLLLHGAAKKLHKGGKSRVVVSDEVQEFIKQGKSVFAKHVVSADAAIVPDQQVIVVNENGELLAAGDALLNAQEMADFRRGAAVSVRWSVSPTRRIQESP